GVGLGARPPLRAAGRHQGPHPPGVAAPSAARRRGGVRRHHGGRHHRAGARLRRRTAGANGGLMTSETLTAVPSTTDRDAGWRDVAVVIGARVVARLRLIAAAIRPLAWVLIAAAVVFWIGGQLLGWVEFTVAAVVIALTL